MFSRAQPTMGDTARKRQKVSHEREAIRQPTSTKASGSKHDHSEGSNDCHYQATLRKLEPDLEAMRQLITCKMCYRFLTEPYSLACGHTYCYICLDAWLVTQKKQTCPDCRAVVKFQPTPSFIVREMTIIFTTRPELLSDEENLGEHVNFATEAAARVASDKAKGTENDSGLFSGIFSKRRQRPDNIIDDEDGVERCGRCLYEIEDGACPNCAQRHDSWSSDGESENSGDEEIDHELFAEHDGTYLDGELDEDDFDAPHIDENVFGVLPQPHRPGLIQRARDEARRQRARAHAIAIGSESEESSEEEEDDTHLDGFVVSEAEESNNSESNSEEGSDDEPEAQSTPAVPRRRVHRRAPIVIDSDDEEGAVRAPATTATAQDTDDDAPIMTHRTRRKAPSHGTTLHLRRSTATSSNRRAPAQRSRISSDSDDDSNDDNEQAGISVTARSRGNDGAIGRAVARAGFSPLQSHDSQEDEDDDDSDDSSEQSSSTARDSEPEEGYDDEEITMDNVEFNYHSDDDDYSRYTATY